MRGETRSVPGWNRCIAYVPRRVRYEIAVPAHQCRYEAHARSAGVRLCWIHYGSAKRRAPAVAKNQIRLFA